jgi:hypothetical protein
MTKLIFIELPKLLPSWEWREFLLVPALAPDKP